MLAYVQKLTTSSEYIRRVAPKEWEEFTHALDEYTAYLINRMVAATVDMLPQEQGRVQALAELNQVLREAPQVMEKMENPKHTNTRANSHRNSGAFQ